MDNKEIVLLASVIVVLILLTELHITPLYVQLGRILYHGKGREVPQFVRANITENGDYIILSCQSNFRKIIPPYCGWAWCEAKAWGWVISQGKSGFNILGKGSSSYVTINYKNPSYPDAWQTYFTMVIPKDKYKGEKIILICSGYAGDYHQFGRSFILPEDMVLACSLRKMGFPPEIAYSQLGYLQEGDKIVSTTPNKITFYNPNKGYWTLDFRYEGSNAYAKYGVRGNALGVCDDNDATISLFGEQIGNVHFRYDAKTVDLTTPPPPEEKTIWDVIIKYILNILRSIID